MYLSRLITTKGAGAVAALVAVMALSSCSDSFIYDDLPACVPEYRVKLSYLKNMANEERVNQVQAAEVYAFDQDGNFVTSSTADLATLQANDYSIPVDLKRFETYDLVIWGGLTEESPFSLDHTRAEITKESLTCRLATEDDGRGNAVSKNRMPALFHHAGTYTFTEEDGEEVQTAELTKNTNTIVVTSRKDNNSQMGATEFPVRIIDFNGVMAHDNSIKEPDAVHYHAVDSELGTYPIPDGMGGVSGVSGPALRSEFHVARLMDGSTAKIEVFDGHDGAVLCKIDLMEMIEKAWEKEAPTGMDLQEYLDRQDEYDVDLSFHVEEQYLHIGVNVNGWAWTFQPIEWN